MKYLGSRLLKTNRLELRPQTMKEQYYLWQLIMNSEINKYYLTVPRKFREKLKIWETQEQYYIEEMKHANDKDTFKWSIYLKDTNQCIGRITCHEAHDEDNQINDPSIRGVGWFIDPKYQGMGYATEAASKMIDYMFNECEIKEIKTSAAVKNPSSWMLMEKCGFIRKNETKLVEYTYLDETVENYQYYLTKEMYKRKTLFETVKTTEELFEFMEKNIKYGVIDKNGKYYDWNLDNFQEVCNHDWKFREGKEIATIGIGHCWDQTELERTWFKQNNDKIKTIFIFFEHNTKYPYGCHTYLIYKNKNNDKWYWFEHADNQNKGIHEFKNEEEAILAQMKTHIEYNKSLGFPMNEEVISWIRIYEFLPPEKGVNNQGYLKNIFSKNSINITKEIVQYKNNQEKNFNSKRK